MLNIEKINEWYHATIIINMCDQNQYNSMPIKLNDYLIQLVTDT